MSPNVLHQLWKIIDTADPRVVAVMDEPNLVDWLLQQLRLYPGPADPGDSEVTRYIQSRLPMIQELAYERLKQW
ncbi:MAG: hypothetical protein AAF215_04165 [Cyanobacteria bacterium P01_A01_bin.123]